MKPAEVAASAPPFVSLLPEWRELAIGAFVVYACLSGDRRPLPLLGSAADIVTATMVFEFFICLPAAFASGVTANTPTRKRVTSCLIGVVVYLAVTLLQLVKFGMPWLFVQCLWTLYARIRPPSPLAWFSPVHCRMISNVCMTAWIGVLVTIALLFGIGGLAGNLDAETGSTVLPPWGYALVWGIYYAINAFATPWARAHALRPPRPSAAPRDQYDLAAARRRHKQRRRLRR